jgi:phosphoglycerate dehydrogenase-like enzyme
VAPAAIALTDDTQGVAAAVADWRALDGRANIEVFRRPFASEDEAARELAPFQIIVPMRERTPFPRSLIEALPNLTMIALTGKRAPSLDVTACTDRGIVVCNTEMDSLAATAELAFGLIVSCARSLPAADALLRAGGWHEGLPLGMALQGRRLGIVGLGRLGSRVAGFGRAFGMDVVAWSQNLTAQAASEEGVLRVEKDELFATSDVVSIHLVLSQRTRGLVGGHELSLMRDGATLINTSRGPIVEETALVEALSSGRIRAGLDVFDQEPLPRDHGLRTLPNVVLTPHLGYSTRAVFEQVYRQSVENVVAFLDGEPIRMVNPEAWAAGLHRPAV